MFHNIELVPATISDIGSDDLEWVERNDYWAKETIKKSRGPARRYTAIDSLILCGHGVRLRLDGGTLHIRNGFTHYPQKQEEWRFFPGDPGLPSRIIMVDGDGGISFDVLKWLTKYQIPMIQLDWRGEIISVLGGSGYAADQRLVEAQLAARHNGRGFTFALSMIEQKLVSSRDTLRKVVPRSTNQVRAMKALELDIDELRNSPPKSLSALLGIEGRAAHAYFKAWKFVRLQWKENPKKPIPDHWRLIGPRNSTKSQTGQNAVHPINAMLNYAYAALESRIRTALIAAGLDPRIGYLHAAKSDRASLAFDLMEPLRSIVDRNILKLVLSEIFTPGDFTIREDGVCRLNPHLARRIVLEAQKVDGIDELIRKLVRGITNSFKS